jgi:hypothetical protein
LAAILPWSCVSFSNFRGLGETKDTNEQPIPNETSPDAILKDLASYIVDGNDQDKLQFLSADFPDAQLSSDDDDNNGLTRDLPDDSNVEDPLTEFGDQNSYSKSEGDEDDFSLIEETPESTVAHDHESEEEQETLPQENDEPPSPTEAEIVRNIWTSTARIKASEPYHLCLRCMQAGHVLKDCQLPDQSLEYSWSLQQLLLEQMTEEDESSEGKLCPRCESIDMLRKFNTYLPYSYQDYKDTQVQYLTERRIEDFFSLGPADSVVFRTDCSLCRLLFATAPRSPPNKQQLLIVPAWTLHHFERDLDVPWSVGRNYAICLYVGIKQLSSSSYFSHLTYPSESLDAICLDEDDYRDERTLCGRTVDVKSLDVDVIQGWLTRCQNFHKSTCRPKFFQGPLQFRLVDVRTRQVVRFSREEHREYIALSYVWGNVSQPSVRVGEKLGKLPPPSKIR